MSPLQFHKWLRLHEARLRDITQLKTLGVTTGWAAPYVLLDGRRTPEQLRLW